MVFFVKVLFFYSRAGHPSAPADMPPLGVHAHKKSTYPKISAILKITTLLNL